MIHKSSVLLSQIEEDQVDIGPFVYIGKDVVLGKNVRIHPSVVIEDGVTIGNDVEIFPGAYIGKPVKGPALGSHSTFERVLTVGDGCVIGPHATLYYGDKIGAYTLISDGASIRENVTIGSYCTIGRNVTINYETQIGDHVRIIDLAHITAHSHIMDYVFIAPGVMMADDNGFGKNPNISPEEVGGATIEYNASIGLGALLLPKIKIGKDSIVAAGALVARNVEEESLAMGFPAKNYFGKKDRKKHRSRTKEPASSGDPKQHSK